MPERVDLAALAAAFPARYPCLLESVAHGTATSCWDLLPGFPQGELRLHPDGTLSRDGVVLDNPDFLAALDADWRQARAPRGADDLPFHGGWALFLGYELAACIEPSLRLPPCPDATPVALALRCPAAVIRDHRDGCTWLVAEAGQAALLNRMRADIEASRRPLPACPAPLRLREETPQRYLDAVRAAHEHLRAGDVFQANLSRAWDVTFADDVEPAALYAALRRANPAPFAALWQQPDWAVVSSSPERLVSVRDRHVDTRPIAGTRPRRAGDDDTGRIAELRAHPKERAEHVMLVDLERNDLGRVCRPGTVRVDELMTVESYAHVHHLVSHVSGTLRDEVTPGEVIAATFPGGTITGCPKVRCMQIIATLEGEGRGAYTGSIGYLDRNGDMDLNILIRSLAVTGRQARFRAGAGIVVDSVAGNELEETRAKARGLIRALEIRDDDDTPAHQRHT